MDNPKTGTAGSKWEECSCLLLARFIGRMAPDGLANRGAWLEVRVHPEPETIDQVFPRGKDQTGGHRAARSRRWTPVMHADHELGVSCMCGRKTTGSSTNTRKVLTTKSARIQSRLSARVRVRLYLERGKAGRERASQNGQEPCITNLARLSPFWDAPEGAETSSTIVRF
jgi:hypothetical protein